MTLSIARHLPLITACIEFTDKPIAPRPAITTDLDFSDLFEVVEDDDELETLTHDDSVSQRGISPLSMLSDSSSDDMPLPVAQAPNNKVPQPFGQPGRPGSGGHSIRHELSAWGTELLDEFEAFVQIACDAHLDINKSYSKQEKSSISKVCVITKNRFPIVNKYVNFWPVHDVIKMHLKKTSESYRKQRGVKSR